MRRGRGRRRVRGGAPAGCWAVLTPALPNARISASFRIRVPTPAALVHRRLTRAPEALSAILTRRGRRRRRRRRRRWWEWQPPWLRRSRGWYRALTIDQFSERRIRCREATAKDAPQTKCPLDATSGIRGAWHLKDALKLVLAGHVNVGWRRRRRRRWDRRAGWRRGGWRRGLGAARGAATALAPRALTVPRRSVGSAPPRATPRGWRERRRLRRRQRWRRR